MSPIDFSTGYFTFFGVEVGLAPSIVIAFIIVLLLFFLFFYVAPGIGFVSKTKILAREIKRLRAANQDVSPESVRKLMNGQKLLAHLWSEYEGTLHEQWETIAGERRRVRVRATMPAETYFSSEILVDSGLTTEFFKHLPGILTGIGIIGTFYGLVSGLARFNLQLEPEQLQISIAHLMGAVQGAFVASGFAIFVAMVITLVEKLLLAKCYKAAEGLAQAIDSLYEAGAGEEYLERLVRSSEESAVQTRQLKDFLVDDMRQLLTELTERQIDASRHQGELLAGNVGDAIRTSLAEPMKVITEAVDRTTSRQGDAVQGMLENLLSAFMSKLDGSIGGQMNGLQEMMAGTVQAMNGMRTDFANMVEKMRETSGKASQAATEQVIRLMAEAEERQHQMGAAFLDAIREMRQQVAGGQAEMQEQTARTLEQLRVTLQEMLEEIRRQREEASRSTAEGLVQLRDSLAGAVEQIRKTAEDMGQTGGDQLAKMLQMAEERQEALSNSLRQALDEMGRRAADGNQALQSKTAELLERIGSTIGDMLEEIRRQREEASKAAREDLAEMKTTLIELTTSVHDSGAVAADANKAYARDLFDEVSRRQKDAEAQALQAQEVAREKLQETMGIMATGLSSFMEFAEVRERRQSEAAQEFQHGVAQRTADVLEALDRRLSELGTNSALAVESMRSAIDALNGATGRAIDGMSRGADTMLLAANGFTEASGKVETTVTRTSEMLDRVVSASSSLEMSVRAVESVVSSYNATRDTLQVLTTTLQGVVQDADARAGISREIVETMQTVVADFRRVQV